MRRQVAKTPVKPSNVPSLDIVAHSDRMEQLQDRTPASKDRPDSARRPSSSRERLALPVAPTPPKPPTPPTMPARLQRENSALASSADKERPTRKVAPTGGSSSRSASSIASQRDALEERRRQLEVRRARRQAAEAGPVKVEAGSSSRSRSPSSSSRTQSPSRRMERDNSALMSGTSKERPSRRPKRQGDADPDVEA